MKKLFFTLSTILILFGCSSSDDSSNSNLNSASISPPSWIHGTWVLDGSTYGYKFTSDDFILKTLSDLSFKESVNSTLSSGQTASTTETKTDSSYEISITILTTTYNYHFVKISPTIIEWVNDPQGSLVHTYYTKQ